MAKLRALIKMSVYYKHGPSRWIIIANTNGYENQFRHLYMHGYELQSLRAFFWW